MRGGDGTSWLLLCLLWTTAAAFQDLNTTSYNPDCIHDLHTDWWYIQQQHHYLAALRKEPTTFYQASETCHNNKAILTFPADEQQLEFYSKLATALGARLHVGVYLPMTTSLEVQCRRQECNDFLKLADGSDFEWAPWMEDAFNRRPKQPRCYQQIPAQAEFLKSVKPESCYEPLLTLCTANCPPPGPLVQPPPMSVIRTIPQHSPALLYHHNLQVRQSRKKENNYNASADTFLSLPASSSNFSGLADINSLPKDPNFGLDKTPDPRHLVAYDCSSPMGLTPIQAQSENFACKEPPEPREQRNATFLLLQKRATIPVDTLQCHAQQTVLPFYCGMFSHGVFAPNWMKEREEVPISATECRRLHKTLTYIDPRGGTHTLQPNTKNKVYFNEAGFVRVVKNSVQCTGTTITKGDKTYDHMVVPVAMTISLFHQPAEIQDSGLVHVLRPDVLMDCPEKEGSCSTAHHGTFVWTPQKDTCHYALSRRVEGIVITDNHGTDTFMSTDGSLVRLLIKEPISKCGVVLLATNYDLLFLSRDLRHPPFTPLRPEDVSVITYCNQQDGWLMGTLTQFVRREFNSLHTQNCKTQLSRENLAYDSLLADQHGSVDGDTASLGGGMFVSTAGEVWYRFRCRRIIVQARTSDKCYSSIPVLLSPHDERRYRTQRNLSLHEPLDFFVASHSRRLTTIGINIPCSSVFHPMYRGLNGNWIKLSPAISFIQPPPVMDAQSLASLVLEDIPDPDFDHGGIYDSAVIRAIDSRTTSSRTIQDVENSIAQKVQTTNWQSGVNSTLQLFTPDNLFQFAESMVPTWMPKWLEPLLPFWNFLKHWAFWIGLMGAILWGCIIIYKCSNCCGCCNCIPFRRILNATGLSERFAGIRERLNGAMPPMPPIPGQWNNNPVHANAPQPPAHQNLPLTPRAPEVAPHKPHGYFLPNDGNPYTAQPMTREEATQRISGELDSPVAVTHHYDVPSGSTTPGQIDHPLTTEAEVHANGSHPPTNMWPKPTSSMADVDASLKDLLEVTTVSLQEMDESIKCLSDMARMSTATSGASSIPPPLPENLMAQLEQLMKQLETMPHSEPTLTKTLLPDVSHIVTKVRRQSPLSATELKTYKKIRRSVFEMATDARYSYPMIKKPRSTSPTVCLA